MSLCHHFEIVFWFSYTWVPVSWVQCPPLSQFMFQFCWNRSSSSIGGKVIFLRSYMSGDGQWGKGVRVSIKSSIIGLILNRFHGIEQRVAYSEWFFWGLFKSIVSAILSNFFLEFLLNLFIFVLFIARQLQFKTKGYLCSRYLSTWYLVNFICLLAFLFFNFLFLASVDFSDWLS